MTLSRSVVRSVISSCLVACAVAGAHPGAGQVPSESPSSLFDRLHFREIGPATTSGRVDDFAVLESNPAVFYVATASGGLWKTVNQGTTFTPIFDHQPTASIGDVAIAPEDANLVWVGTGENNNRQSSSWGEGVYKSTDGGASWKHMGLADSKHIARIIVDPIDHDRVYVAALGSLWGPGGDRGVYRTSDGGLTWERVLHVDDETGATELVMDPSNNKVLYAATYQRRRATWGFNGGGPGSAIWKSTDGGRSWTKLTTGIPDGPLGRIGLDIYRRNPNVIYARIEHATQSGVYRSDDAGASWRKLAAVNPRPMYFSQIRIDPQTDSRIYVLGVQLHVSDDGGRTFRDTGARKVHVDHHAMWINPANPNHLMVGNDGGVAISYDRSETYMTLKNMPIGHFYHVAYDMQSPYTVCGGLQDNNTWCGPSAMRSSGGIANDDWFSIAGGDGFVAELDPSDPNILYGESQDGRLNRVDRTTNERKAIRPEPPEGEPAYRWNWDTPVLVSPHDPRTIFIAANRVFRSRDRGHSWEIVSPDLTTNSNRDGLALMGVMGNQIAIARNDGVSAYGTIVTFAESPKTAGIYWAGSDDGIVSVSRDAGKSWTSVTDKIPGLPKNTYVSRLAPSRFDERTVYASFDGHRLNDFGTHIYASPDFGNTWRSIVGDLPKGQVVRTVTEDVRQPDVLYVGTESGLYVTLDRGRRWLRVKANLPTVPVHEITLHPRDDDLILATHGRSIWILDDLTPFQEFADASKTDARLFTPPPATQRNQASDRARRNDGDLIFLGDNPPAGASLSYYLKSPARELKLAIQDASGTLVREIDGDQVSAERAAGVHTVTWDLRVAPVRPVTGQSDGEDRIGPLVLPGEYRVTLTVEGRDAGTQSVRVAGDPEITITDADRKVHFATLMTLHRLHQAANDAASAVRASVDQLQSVREALERRAAVPDAITARVAEVSRQFEGLRRRFGAGGGGGPGGGAENVRGRIGQLKSQIMGSTSVPTTTQARQIVETQAALTKAIDEANRIMAALPALYRELAEQNLYPTTPKPIGPITN